MLVDPALPAAASLLNAARAAEILAPALASTGGDLLSATPTQVSYRPGQRLVVRYRADVAWPGERRVETAVLMADAHRLPHGSAVVSDGEGQQVGAWTYPHDPFLPGLRSATAPEAVRGLLRELGAAEGSVRITPRVYRPTSRAVLSVESSRELYLKIVRPRAAGPLYRLHAAVAPRIPVPIAYGTAEPQGIVVLETRRGESLGSALSTARPVPSPSELLDLLDCLAPMAAPEGSFSPPHDAAAANAETLAGVAPSVAERARAIAAAARADWTPDRCVHGDFYESQVLVADGRISALLDIDEMRPGDALDDVATLLAHLDVLAWHRRQAAPRIRAYRAAVQEAVVGRGAAELLARRVAGALVGLALWPFRAQLPDWQHATSQLLDRAAAALGRDGEDLLIRPSRPLHSVR
ncbi:MAG TPA: phosphotransferase [Egibacteraceae bacterium]|nr:phosphotransferase [Egibacteraceae bacterium]